MTTTPNKHLRQDRTLDQRMCAIARMSFGISHDLNNALGAVQSNAGILRNHLPGDSPLLTNLNHIQHATHHMIDLSHQLQIYTQHQKVALQSVDLRTLLAESIATFRPKLPEHCRLQDQSPRGRLTVETCPLMLENAIMAILQNALDALQGLPGTITIETSIGQSRIEDDHALMLGTLPATDHVALIEISDTGEGIFPEVLEHIFEPFFSTRLRARGMGLTPVVGLAFHGNAAVRVVSRPHHGTNVQLLLPIPEHQGLRSSCD